MSHVQVVDYNPLWKEYFELEFIRIKEVLGSLCLEIHHVGSTAVPGLCAKPKIDIIAVFSTLSFEHTLLESHGYQYAGGFNIPLRKSFTRRVSRGALFDVNLHVFILHVL